MAYHTSLPIYSPAYGLQKLIFKYAANMPRSFKKIMGERICNLALEVVLLIGDANAADDKRPHLAILIRHARTLGVLLRTCQDLHLISPKQYADSVALTESVSKQATRWKQSNASSPAV